MHLICFGVRVTFPGGPGRSRLVPYSRRSPGTPWIATVGPAGNVDTRISAPDYTTFGIGVQNYIFSLGSPQRKSNDRPNVKRILDQTLLEQNISMLLLLFTMNHLDLGKIGYVLRTAGSFLYSL